MQGVQGMVELRVRSRGLIRVAALWCPCPRRVKHSSGSSCALPGLPLGDDFSKPWLGLGKPTGLCDGGPWSPGLASQPL